MLLRSVLSMLLLLCVCACAPQFKAPEADAGRPQLLDASFISFDGSHLPLQRWLPASKPQAVIIALHGFNDYANFINDAAEFFSTNGMAVYAYDQRGFGRAAHRGLWPGRDVFARDLQVFTRLIRDRFPDRPLFLLGESMGAAVVLHAIASGQMDVNGVIFSAPAVWGWDAMPWWQVWGLKLGATFMPWKRFTGQSLGIIASDNRDMLIALGRDPLVIKATRVDTMYGLVNLMQAGSEAAAGLNEPALVLYGEKDEVIPKQPVLELFEPNSGPNSGQQRLVVYHNGYHMLLRDLQAPVVWRDILVWIRNQHVTLPSQQQGLSTAP